MGLKAGDLTDLVSEIISIDEYESKLDDDAIVVALFCKFKEPANDLNKFIQKVGKDVIDTDVSPSVTESGDFVVFIEMYRNEHFITDLTYLMKYISELTDNDEWFFTCYKHDKVYELNEENLENTVRLEDRETSDIAEFFSNSMIDNILIEGKKCSIIKNNKTRMVFDVIRISDLNENVENFLTESDLKDLFNIELLFGNMTAEKSDDGYVLYNGKKFMTVKEIEECPHY